MNSEMEEVLRLFQCDYNRGIEEDFARTLTENDNVRLFFVNENAAFTDGRNIVVDPASGEVFSDTTALERAEDFMKLPHSISQDPWYALRTMTRGQNIHECLHIIYTDFPNPVLKDERSSTKARIKTLALISNIIEDAFIEAAGCSVYDNLELYLMFERLALLYGNTSLEGTVDRAFKEENSGREQPVPITEYLEYMGLFLLYPMVKLSAPPESISKYVEKTKQLFLDGSVCGNSAERFEYSQKIFDIIEPLIPNSEEIINDTALKKMLTGSKTHSGNPSAITNIESKGKDVVILRRMFTRLDGKPLSETDFSGQIFRIIEDYENDKNAALVILLTDTETIVTDGMEYDCHSIHKGIKIIETKPKPNLNLRQAYKNVYNKYHININSYNSRFTRLLKARVDVREEKKLFGAGILSKNLVDTKKRYWYKNSEGLGIPDIAVMLLIDGSGSMDGDRREGAMASSVILHEVLKKQGIAHSIVEHRAIYGEPEVRHNILVGFNGRDEEKYNILLLEAEEGTREGLSLYWAERYIAKNTSAEKRLIIVLSDGVPAHDAGDETCEYYPPVSIKDTANAATKIIKRGTDIIAVALDDDDDGCYEWLSEIYPSVVACTDLKRLTGQLLGIVTKNLQ